MRVLSTHIYLIASLPGLGSFLVKYNLKYKKKQFTLDLVALQICTLHIDTHGGLNYMVNKNTSAREGSKKNMLFSRIFHMDRFIVEYIVPLSVIMCQL